MKHNKALIVLWITLVSNLCIAQYCTDDHRFSEVEYFSNTQIDSLTNVTYGNALNWEGVSEELKMDFYFPKIEFDPLGQRPYILLIHGGGFTDGDKSRYKFECKKLAKRGFVVATMNYRLGYDESDPSNLVNAVYRAQQDANAALRYTIEIGSSLKIDPSWLFLGGGSAGSITSLFTKYMSQEEWNILFSDLEPLLGAIDTSGNDLPHTFELQGILNQWGAAPDSATTTDELTPMISFHGALDNVIPIGAGPFGTIGSQYLHWRLVENDVCSDFTLDPEGTHVVYNTIEGREFMLNRTCCFFKSLFCEDCTEFFSTEPIEADCSNLLNINESTTNEVDVYPNPFKEQFNLSNLNGNEYFSLYDIHGHIIYQGSDIKSKNFNHLSSGLYLLMIHKDKQQHTLKLYKN